MGGGETDVTDRDRPRCPRGRRRVDALEGPRREALTRGDLRRIHRGRGSRGRPPRAGHRRRNAPLAGPTPRRARHAGAGARVVGTLGGGRPPDERHRHEPRHARDAAHRGGGSDGARLVEGRDVAGDRGAIGACGRRRCDLARDAGVVARGRPRRRHHPLRCGLRGRGGCARPPPIVARRSGPCTPGAGADDSAGAHVAHRQPRSPR